MPTVDCEMSWFRYARDRQIALTLVFPFLTDIGLESALRTIERAHKDIDALEVVCSDFGLLHELAKSKIAEPVIGRQLVAQARDPRLVRLTSALDATPSTPRTVEHLNGTRCRLLRTQPTSARIAHLRSTWLAEPHARSFMQSLGVCRGELDPVWHGIAIDAVDGWSWSIHWPEVLLATKRCTLSDCNRACPQIQTRLARGLPACSERDNAWYVDCGTPPISPCADRIVIASRMQSRFLQQPTKVR
jgi:hypothetical protein